MTERIRKGMRTMLGNTWTWVREEKKFLLGDMGCDVRYSFFSVCTS